MQDTTTRYFSEVGRLAMPTKAEERKNFLEYRAVKRALDTMLSHAARRELEAKKAKLGGELAKGYLRFVNGKASERTFDKELLSDLIGAGNEGLMIAVNKYDPDYRSQKTGKPVRFLTYAAWWIDVKMDELIHRLGTVHMSVHSRKQAAQLGAEFLDPIMSSIDDVQVASDDDVEDAAFPNGEIALEQVHASGLSRTERVILTFSLGLRGKPHEDTELIQILYSLDGSVFMLKEIRALRESAIEKMQAWHAAHPEARSELVRR